MSTNPQLGINPKVERQICLNSIIKMINTQKLITIESNISIYNTLKFSTKDLTLETLAIKAIL